jgi:hypothetical protein
MQLELEFPLLQAWQYSNLSPKFAHVGLYMSRALPEEAEDSWLGPGGIEQDNMSTLHGRSEYLPKTSLI